MRLPLTTDLENVPEAGGGDQRGRGHFAFDQRIGRDRSAVAEIVDVAWLGASFGENLIDAALHCQRRVGRGGGSLVKEHAPVTGTDQHKIGEGSSDVDAEDVTLGLFR